MAESGSDEHKYAPNLEEQKSSKSQWDQLDRDELVKQIKKQLMLLQKMKQKCDDVGKKNATMEIELNERNSECADLKVKLELAENEKEHGSNEISSLELDKLNLSRKIKALEEQVECMMLKQETANTTFSCLQEEIKKMQTKNKDLTEEISVLGAARDEALQSLKSVKKTLTLELDDLKKDLLMAQEGQSNAIKENKSLLEEIEMAHHDLKNSESKHFELEKNYNELKSQYESLNRELSIAQDTVAQLNKSLVECNQNLEDSFIEKQSLASKLQNYHALEVEVEELRCREKADKEVFNRDLKNELDETKLKFKQAFDEKLALNEKLVAMQLDYNALQLRFGEIELSNAALEAKYCELLNENTALNKELHCSDARIQLLDNSLTDTQEIVDKLSHEMLILTFEKTDCKHLQQQLNELTAVKESLQNKIDSRELLLTEIYQFASSLMNRDDVSKDVQLHFNANVDVLQMLKDAVPCTSPIGGSIFSEEESVQIISKLKDKIVKFETSNYNLLENLQNLESLIATLTSKVTNLEALTETEVCSVACETEKITCESVCISTSNTETVDVFTETVQEFVGNSCDFQNFAQKEISKECFAMNTHIPHNLRVSIENIIKVDKSTETNDMENRMDYVAEKVDAYTEIAEEWLITDKHVFDGAVSSFSNIEKLEKSTEIDESFILNQIDDPVDHARNSSAVLGSEGSLLHATLKNDMQPEGINIATLLDFSSEVCQLREIGKAMECSLQNIFLIFKESEETENQNHDLYAELKKFILQLDALPVSSEGDPKLIFFKEIQRLDSFNKIIFTLSNILMKHMPEWKAWLQAVSKDVNDKENLTTVKAHQLHSSTKKLENDLKDAEDLISKYKNVAIKVKKEAVELKKRVSDINSEFEKAVEERDLLRNQMERMSAQLAVVAKERGATEDKERSLELQLIQEREKHKIILNKLDHALKEANKTNLISLEIADYERLMKDLNKQMESKVVEIEKLQTEIEFHKEKNDGYAAQIEQLEEQKLQSEARAEQLKSVTLKLKSEIANFQKVEGEWKTLESSLSAQVETTSREAENCKLQIANALADNQRLQESCRAMQDAHSRTICLLESRNNSHVEELRKVKSDYMACQLEYEGYKVRVHSVLKNKKSKMGSSESFVASPRSHTSDIKDEEKEQLEKAVEALQTRVQELVAQLATVKGELETLQEEHDSLLQRHNKLVLNLSEQDLSWKQRVERLQKDLINEQKEHADVLRHIQQQHQLTLNLSLKQQMEALQKDHNQQLEEVQLKLDLAHDELLRLQKEITDLKLASANLVRDEDVIVDVLNTERQEGEGSEFTDTVCGTPQKNSPPNSGFVPLDQLLNQDQLSISSVSTLETEKLENQLGVATRRIEHLTEILHESEATNARMAEQTRLLKEEIRRLERNQEREKHFANMEYVKNVIIKFLSLPSGDEREHLVPVLTMLLRLSREEEQQLQNIAKGSVEPETMSGWGSYLPRWPGT